MSSGGCITAALVMTPSKLVHHRSLAVLLEHSVDYRLLPDHSIYLLEQEHCLTGHALAACHMADRNKINPFAATSLLHLDPDGFCSCRNENIFATDGD